MADSIGVPNDNSHETIGVVVIHGVGETEPGWIDDYLVPNLQTADPGFAPELHGRVIKLPEATEFAGHNGKFTVHLRDGDLDNGSRVHLIEMFWADISRSSNSKLVDTLGSLRLFFEAPHVAARAMLPRDPSGLDGILRKLILRAIGLLRGPVTGLNICFLAVAFAQVYYINVPKLQTLSLFYVGAGTLALLGIGSAFLHFFLRNRDSTWDDLSKATSWVAAGLLLIFLTNPFHGRLDALASPLQYFWTFRPILAVGWGIWAAILITAVVLLLVRIIFYPSNRVVRQRLSAALAIATAQCAFWLTILPILGVIVINAAANNQYPSDKTFMVEWRSIFQPPETISLSVAAQKLSGALWVSFAFDAICFAVVIVLIVATVLLRRLVLKWHGSDLNRSVSSVPRLIANTGIVWAIILSGIVLAPIEILQAQEDVSKPWLIALAPYAVIVLYMGRTIWNLVHARVAVGVHIARDLVDHHTSRADYLGGRLARDDGANRLIKPKRARIQRRLESTLHHLAAVTNPQRVLFVAHSQGTVILLEFLRDGENLRRIFPNATIDIITLGSPISHIYGHYFHEYDDIRTIILRSNAIVSSWHNMYRVDDPIANRIDSDEPGFPTNEPLKKGGHTGYWSEPQVCSKIMDMVRDPAPSRAGKTRQARTSNP